MRSNIRPFGPIAIALAFALSLPAAGCAGPQTVPAHTHPAPSPAGPPLVGKPTVETRLFFGTKIGLEKEVSDAEWTAFVDRAITPRFPDGLTVVEVLGQYRMRDSGKIVRERTHMVILLHEGKDETNRAIREIVEAYRKGYQQESVLRMDAVADVTF